MNVLKRFRLLTVRLTLLLSVVAAAITYAISVAVAKGVLAGGITGALGFWVNAVQAEKLASMTKKQVHSAVYRWTFIRMGLYALTFYWAYRLDPESLRGILGAVGGFFIVQIVLIGIGLTGIDLKEENEANGTNR